MSFLEPAYDSETLIYAKDKNKEVKHLTERLYAESLERGR
jgi:hypothetical protein